MAVSSQQSAVDCQNQDFQDSRIFRMTESVVSGESFQLAGLNISSAVVGLFACIIHRNGGIPMLIIDGL